MILQSLVCLLLLINLPVQGDPPGKSKQKEQELELDIDLSKIKIPDEVLSGMPARPDTFRIDRIKRWRIKFKYENAKEFVDQLIELKVIVGARYQNKFLLFDKFPQAGEWLTVDEFQKRMQKLEWLFVQNRSEEVCSKFAEGAKLKEIPGHIFLLLPPEMEKAILDVELKHHQMTEKEINAKPIRTQFDVRRKDDKWIVKVLPPDTQAEGKKP